MSDWDRFLEQHKSFGEPGGAVDALPDLASRVESIARDWQASRS